MYQPHEALLTTSPTGRTTRHHIYFTKTVIVRLTMLKWLLLLSLFTPGLQESNGQENAVLHCGAQNMSVKYSDQMILLNWEDDPSCSPFGEKLIYEVVIAIADKTLYDDEVAVTPDQIGSTHSWSWTSHLLTECTSVRLRSRYKSHTGPWLHELTGKVKSTNNTEVFPKNKVFEVGSRVTFCCFVPPGLTFDKMNLNGYNTAAMKRTKINDQTYALTVDLHVPSGYSCTDVTCETTSAESGTCTYIGYPPADRDLQCETRDLQSVLCHWTVGRDTHLTSTKELMTIYRLQGSECRDPVNQLERKCRQKVNVGEGKWTLLAENQLGTVELTDRADLTKRVHMFAPKTVKASDVTSRNVSLKWRWTEHQYNNLSIVCQIELNGQISMGNHSGVGLNVVVLNGLTPSESYTARVRCGGKLHFWKWGDWSEKTEIHTRGDIPDALDVWMQTKNSQTLIIWKMLLANQSHGQIIDYRVSWDKGREQQQQHNITHVYPPDHSVALSLDPNKEHVVTVTARNVNGSSSPSAITIPSNYSDRPMNISKISGMSGGFSVSWSASPAAVCGYVLEWYPSFRECVGCAVEWLKVPPGITNGRIVSENFIDGRRYLLSVFACTQGAPVLIERREGYIRETRLPDKYFVELKVKQLDSDVQVSWDAISPEGLTAFIQGYKLYYWDNSAHPENPSRVFNITTDDSEASTLTARGLRIGSYTFILKALTSVGECGDTSISVTMNSLTDNLITALIISLLSVFTLFSLVTIFFYRHWTCVKQKIYPPIPKPVLTDNWMTSPLKHRCRLLSVDSGHHSEVEVVDAQEFPFTPAPVTAASQEGGDHVFAHTQTPKGYYNQLLKNCSLPTLALTSTMSSQQAGLPNDPCVGAVENPSYNLIMKTDRHGMLSSGEQQPNSGPELQEVQSSETKCGDYSPQSPMEACTLTQTEEDTENPVTCEFTYILLPQ
ncbi:leukemia inhibitory factor receptor-like [Genypterus blacodes]|uniref:leukemia inhibitory factor receptor-like n=1 Tax=Genypterus blacodes TaxID=154954 RepID=UPI003F75A4D8